MPSSTPSGISRIVEEIQKTQPKSVLDIGIGFGKWGFLVREYLESWNDRVYPDQWQVRLDGVEAWSRYVEGLPWLEEIYSEIFVSPVERIIEDLEDYDLIIAGDVIEHIEKTTALFVIDQLFQKARKKFILSIPVGPGWMGNTIIDDNPYERHLSEWSTAEVTRLRPQGWTLGFQALAVGDRGVGLFIFTRG